MIDLQYPWVLAIIIPVMVLLILLIRKDFVKFKDKDEQKTYHKKTKFRRALVSASRGLIFLALLLAIAGPFTTKQKQIQGDYSLLLLADNSSSMNMFENIGNDLKTKLEKLIPVQLKYIATSSNSEIGNGILNNMQGDDNLLLITDGNNNQGRDLGDIMLLASTLNTTISAIEINTIQKDAAVSIQGPSKVILDSDNEYIVKVDNIGNIAYNILVRIDQEIVLDDSASASKEFVFTKSFLAGYHEIEAQIIVNDYFPQNNKFYKSVKVEPRPKILFVSNKASPLFEVLSKIYAVDSKTEIPSSLSKYSAIILDDIPASKIQTKVMREYVTDGNGLVVIGGKNSYEYGGYEKSEFESLLPAKVGVADEYSGGVASIIILLDISGSTAGRIGLGKKYRVEAAIASGIIGGLRKEDSVGVIAFDTEAIPVSYLTPMSTKQNLNQTLLSIKSRGGGTDIYYGLLGAKKWFEGLQGGKNIILISDGQTMNPGRALILARSMAETGTRIFTVGVGTGNGKDFMKSMASSGNGIYFEGDDAPKLNILFGEESQKQEQKSKELLIINEEHFITKNLVLRGSLTGYNQIVPKTNAQFLVTTLGNNPILTVWRLGLGRVSTLATDDGALWAGSLLNKDNSKIITRTINWAIGDLSRNKDFDIEVKDSRINQVSDIFVYSQKSFSSDQYSFSKIDENLYNAQYIPDTVGFMEVLGAKTAINYNLEYQKLGFNNQLKELVTLTGGKMLDSSNPSGIVDAVKTMSKRTRSETISLGWIFSVIALLIFLVEIIIRRLGENQNLFK